MHFSVLQPIHYHPDSIKSLGRKFGAREVESLALEESWSLGSYKWPL